MRKLELFFVFIIVMPAFALAGNYHVIDSLQQRLQQVNGKEKVLLLIKLSELNRDVSLSECDSLGIQALNLAKKIHNDSLAGLAVKSLGVSCFLRGDMDKALDYFQKGYEFYKKVHFEKGISNCLNNKGLVYEGWSQFDTAYYYYKQSYDIERELKNKNGMATSLINMGNINFYRKHYVESQKDFFQALKLFTQLQNTTGMGMAYLSVGVIYNELGEYGQALDYLKKSRDIYLKDNDEWNLSRSLNNMADIYNEQLKEYKKALLLYRKVLELKTKLGSKVGIALVKSNLGVLYGHMENITKAEEYFKESFQLYHELKDTSGLCLVYYNWGNALQEAGKHRRALKKFHKGLLLANQIGYYEIESQTYKSLFKSYAALGDYDRFNRYYAKYEATKDSLNLSKQHNQISELEIKYKVKQLVEKGQSLEQKSIQQAKELRKLHVLLAILSSVLVLLVVVWILIKQLKIVNQEVEKKKNEDI